MQQLPNNRVVDQTHFIMIDIDAVRDSGDGIDLNTVVSLLQQGIVLPRDFYNAVPKENFIKSLPGYSKNPS